jgi:hypothetical protein
MKTDSLIPPTDELQLARCIVLANRRRRFRWQADVSGPGSNGASGVARSGCAPDLLDRLEADLEKSMRQG